MEKKQRCCGECDDLLLELGKGGELLIQKILVRLPVKSLGRFKMVSKSWFALIESPSFIDLHTTFNNNNSSSSKYILLASLNKYLPKTSSREHLVIMISSDSESVDSVSRSGSSSGGGGGGCLWGTCSNHDHQDHDDQLVFKVDNNNNNNSGGGGGQQQQQLVFKLDGLGFPEFGDFSKSVVDLGLPSSFKLCEFSKTIVGSCNGLVCIHDDILNEVSPWNPATRQFKILPRAIKVFKDDLPKHLVAFGFDVETKDYKVVLLTTGFSSEFYYRSTALPIECSCQVQVYSLSTDSWRLLEGITCFPGYPFFSYPSKVVCLNGSCFFLAHFFHTKQQRCIAENDRFIISFDFAKEIFTPMQLPDHDRNQKLHLSCLGDKMALFTVRCKPPPHAAGSYYPDFYELPPPRANYPEIYEPPRGIYYSQICEDYSIWVLDEHVTSGSSGSSVNQESWRELHSFQIEHQIPGEWTSPSCISNDGEFVLLETRNSTRLGKKMKLYNLGTKEVEKDFLSCNRVMSRAYAYKPSLVKLMVGSSQQQQQQQQPIEPIG